MTRGTGVVRRYLQAMEKGDLAATLACFTDEAIVNSPVYGAVAARPFYERLFADTVRAELDILDIYVAESDERRVIAHFNYKWERYNKPVMETRLIDLFELDLFSGNISLLRIIFDDRAGA